MGGIFMKKIWMTLLSLGIAFMSMLGIFVSAADIEKREEGTPIETRYEEISYITASISLNDGIILSSGSYHVRLENPQVKLKIIVQESANGTDWEDVRTVSFNKSTPRDSGSTVYAAIDRHFYRTKVVLEVYDSNGKYIESGETHSNSKPYFE